LVLLKIDKLLFCCTEFPPEPGGIGNHAFGLVRELSLVYDIYVLTENRGTSSSFNRFVEKELKNTNVIGVSRACIIVWTYLKRILYFVNLNRNSNIHIFSGTFYIWLSNFSNTNAKKILIVHGSEIKQSGISKFLFQRALSSAHKIVCVSNYTKNKLTEYYSLDIVKNKIKVINNGFIPNNFYNERNDLSPNQNLNLITIGSVHKRKGQHNVLSAIPELIKNGIALEYIIVGLPVEQQWIEALGEKLGVRDKFNILGAVSDEDKWKHLGRSHIFLMLSEELDNGDFEGFGIGLIEAMSAGVPVIGSRNSGISDAINDGYGGHLVDPKNPLEIVSTIQIIMNEYKDYSLRAKVWSQNFTWENIGQKYLNELKDL
jgi:glycosyltransferase involved in cell wall biosynthesis